jgi:hypothetical protein
MLVVVVVKVLIQLMATLLVELVVELLLQTTRLLVVKTLVVVAVLAHKQALQVVRES